MWYLTKPVGGRSESHALRPHLQGVDFLSEKFSSYPAFIVTSGHSPEHTSKARSDIFNTQLANFHHQKPDNRDELTLW